MQEKLNQLSLGEKLVLGGGLLMLIASLFAWWSYSSGPFDVSQDGWSAPGSIWSVLAILISIAMAGLIAATKLGGVNMPQAPQGVTWGQIWGAGAALVVVLMLLKAWRILAVDVGGFGIGFFIGVVATAALAYGGYLLYTADKGTGFRFNR